MKTKNLNEIINDYEKIVKFVIKDMKLGHRYDELYDVGIIGFVRGINTFDEGKGFQYITYLYDCIKNEILHYIHYERSKKRDGEVISLNTIIKGDTELQDLIGYETDYEQNAYVDEMIMVIEKRSEDFTKKQKIVFNHLFGFNGCEQLSTKEISKKYGFSRQSVYQIKKIIIRMLRHTLSNYQNKEGLYTKKPV